MEELSPEYEFDRGTLYFVKGDKAKRQVNAFKDPALGLNEVILQNIQFTKPTPIQCQAMPQIAAELDVMCCSHTGSGKTAAYLLPILDHILIYQQQKPSVVNYDRSHVCHHRQRKPKLGVFQDGNLNVSQTSSHALKKTSTPKALVMVPTRELAEQVCGDCKAFARNTGIKCLAVYGGDSMGKEAQQLRGGDVDIVIATPGRLLHFLEEFAVLSLMETRFLVIDEADEMFNQGFFQDIGKILKDHMKPKEDRVTAMFSATFPQQIRYFANKHLRPDNVFIVIGVLGGASPKIVQDVRCVSAVEKHARLVQILTTNDDKQTLIFCGTIEGVDALVRFLGQKSFCAMPLHSELSQPERHQALSDFNSGVGQILVATSLASRGLNIDNVTIVINYDLPRDINDYIQRIGRGRNSARGDPGLAISFYDPEEDEQLTGPLCSALRSTDQNVPDFLLRADDARKTAIQEIKAAYPHETVDMVNKLRTSSKFPKGFGADVVEDWWG